jgi:DNA-binding CsgD family transcriptional regulator
MSHEWPFSGKDYRDILCLDDILHSNISIQNTQDDILQVLVESLNAESGNFCLHDSNDSAAKRDKTALFNLSWQYTDRYIKYYHRLDPFLYAFPGVNANRDIDVMPWPSWQNLEFYTDFIKPQGISHLLVLYLQDDRQLMGHVGIHRWHSSRTFSHKDLFKARCLARLFSRYFKEKRLFQASADLDFILKRVVNLSSSALVILDSNLQPVYWNTRTVNPGLSHVAWQNSQIYTEERQPVLPSKVINQCMSLRQLLQHKKQRLECEKWCVALQLKPGQLVEIEVLPTGRCPEDGSTRFYFLIVFNETRKAESRRGFSPSSDWVLTPKEMEVIHYINLGLSNKEISNKLFISLPTVATHIRHIFQKLNVNSRSKLTHELRLRMNTLS